MSKNYFTDEQVKQLVPALKNQDYNPNFEGTFVTLGSEELKSLMNLAVETAIGEPYGYEAKTTDGEIELVYQQAVQKYNLVREEDIIRPLYSVKELEN
jgi:hypothetical protein